jgi:hypothetical protein
MLAQMRSWTIMQLLYITFSIRTEGSPEPVAFLEFKNGLVSFNRFPISPTSVTPVGTTSFQALL